MDDATAALRAAVTRVGGQRCQLYEGRNADQAGLLANAGERAARLWRSATAPVDGDAPPAARVLTLDEAVKVGRGEQPGEADVIVAWLLPAPPGVCPTAGTLALVDLDVGGIGGEADQTAVRVVIAPSGVPVHALGSLVLCTRWRAGCHLGRSTSRAPASGDHHLPADPGRPVPYLAVEEARVVIPGPASGVPLPTQDGEVAWRAGFKAQVDSIGTNLLSVLGLVRLLASGALLNAGAGSTGPTFSQLAVVGTVSAVSALHLWADDARFMVELSDDREGSDRQGQPVTTCVVTFVGQDVAILREFLHVGLRLVLPSLKTRVMNKRSASERQVVVFSSGGGSNDFAGGGARLWVCPPDYQLEGSDRVPRPDQVLDRKRRRGADRRNSAKRARGSDAAIATTAAIMGGDSGGEDDGDGGGGGSNLGSPGLSPFSRSQTMRDLCDGFGTRRDRFDDDSTSQNYYGVDEPANDSAAAAAPTPPSPASEVIHFTGTLVRVSANTLVAEFEGGIRLALGHLSLAPAFGRGWWPGTTLSVSNVHVFRDQAGQFRGLGACGYTHIAAESFGGGHQVAPTETVSRGRHPRERVYGALALPDLLWYDAMVDRLVEKFGFLSRRHVGGYLGLTGADGESSPPSFCLAHNLLEVLGHPFSAREAFDAFYTHRLVCPVCTGHDEPVIPRIEALHVHDAVRRARMTPGSDDAHSVLVVSHAALGLPVLAGVLDADLEGSLILTDDTGSIRAIVDGTVPAQMAGTTVLVQRFELVVEALGARLGDGHPAVRTYVRFCLADLRAFVVRAVWAPMVARARVKDRRGETILAAAEFVFARKKTGGHGELKVERAAGKTVAIKSNLLKRVSLPAAARGSPSVAAFYIVHKHGIVCPGGRGATGRRRFLVEGLLVSPDRGGAEVAILDCSGRTGVRLFPHLVRGHAYLIAHLQVTPGARSGVPSLLYAQPNVRAFEIAFVDGGSVGGARVFPTVHAAAARDGSSSGSTKGSPLSVERVVVASSTAFDRLVAACAGALAADALVSVREVLVWRSAGDGGMSGLPNLAPALYDDVQEAVSFVCVVQTVSFREAPSAATVSAAGSGTEPIGGYGDEDRTMLAGKTVVLVCRDVSGPHTVTVYVDAEKHGVGLHMVPGARVAFYRLLRKISRTRNIYCAFVACSSAAVLAFDSDEGRVSSTGRGARSSELATRNHTSPGANFDLASLPMAHLASYVHTTSIMQDIRRFVVSVSGVTRATLRWVCLGCHQTIYGQSEACTNDCGAEAGRHLVSEATVRVDDGTAEAVAFINAKLFWRFFRVAAAEQTSIGNMALRHGELTYRGGGRGWGSARGVASAPTSMPESSAIATAAAGAVPPSAGHVQAAFAATIENGEVMRQVVMYGRPFRYESTRAALGPHRSTRSGSTGGSGSGAAAARLDDKYEVRRVRCGLRSVDTWAPPRLYIRAVDIEEITAEDEILRLAADLEPVV